MTPMNLPEALDSLDVFFQERQASSGSDVTPPPELPRRLMQYWDHEPPRQVTKLLNASETYCTRNDIVFDLYDDARARQLLSEVPDILEAYEASSHPAMKSDLFRLYALYKYGGAYLDADMTVRKTFASVFDAPGSLLLLKWNLTERRNCPNWFFAATAQHPLMHALAHGVAESVMHHQHLSADEIRRRILGVSGPAIFTRYIATFIAEQSPDEARKVSMWDVDKGYKFVMNGPEYLRRKLKYKSTWKHWAFEPDA